MTEIVTAEGRLWCASVIDLFSRRLPGYAVGEHHDAQLVAAALQMAVATRGGVLKVEFVHRQAFATRAEARIRIATWIADFSNTRRRHSAAGGLAPTEFERVMKERRSINDLQAARAA